MINCRRFFRRINITPIIILCLIFFSFYNQNDDYDFLIIFNNKAKEKISGLKITYYGIIKDLDVPEILPKKKLEIKIKPTEDFGENSMSLIYYDKNSKKHSEMLLGYFEKGYKATIKVDILEIDENGILKVNIEDNLSSY